MNARFTVLCGAILMVCGQAWAQTTFSYNFSGGSGQASSPYQLTNNGVTVTIQAWANTRTAGTTPDDYTLENQHVSGSYGIYYYGSSGFGIHNRDACTSAWNCGDFQEGTNPEHAIDNEQRYDMVLLNFGSTQVNLTAFDIGWKGADSDMTLMAFTPGAGGDPTLAGKTWGSLVANGWTTVKSFADVPVGTGTTSVGLAGVYSSYWLIGAANDLVGGSGLTCAMQSRSVYVGKDYWGNPKYETKSVETCDWDYVKLLSVAGVTKKPDEGGGVPEPGSLALLGLAFVGMISVRQRRKA